MSHPGQTLGRYELIARIGEGGMAEVHLARQRGPRAFEKLVVVKTVHPRLAAKPALAEALLEEARIAAKVRHPHVVDIYDLGEEGGTYFIAMEYLEGESLTSIIRAQRAKGGERLSPLRTAQVVCDCAAGLHAAHELRSLSGEPLELVHQDVTPGNVFVLYTGQAKLLDFGVAKVRTSDEAGLIKGKAGYLAPELFDKQAADRQSDVFALGVVLWESLTLRRLFSGPTEADTFAKIRACDVPVPSSLVPGLPPELDAICARALARSRDDRYPTARALQDDLVALLRGIERNDYEAMATYMRRTFATHITARQDLLRELDRGGAPAAGTLAALAAAFDDRSPATPLPTAEPPPATLGAKSIAGGKRLAPLPAPRAKLPPLPAVKAAAAPTTDAGSAPGADPSRDGARPTTDAPQPDARDELAPRGDAIAVTPEPALALRSAATPVGADDVDEVSGVIEEPSAPVAVAAATLASPEAASSEAPLAPSPRLPTLDEPTAKGEVAALDGDELGEESSGRRRSRRWWIAGGIGAAALVAIVAAVAGRGEKTRTTAAPRPVAVADRVEDRQPDAAPAVIAVEPIDAGLEVDAAPARVAPQPPRITLDPPERDPRKATELTQTGLKQVMSGDTARAIASFQAALRADRGHAPAYRGLGLAYEKQQNNTGAARAYRSYLRLAPSARDAAAIRARLETLR